MNFAKTQSCHRFQRMFLLMSFVCSFLNFILNISDLKYKEVLQVIYSFRQSWKDFFWTITYIFLNRRRNIFIFTCFIILIVVKIITFILWSFVGVFNKFLIKSVVTKSVDFIFQICSRQVTTLIFFPQKIQYLFSGYFVFTFSWMWWILSVNCDISNFKQRLYFKYIKFKAISNRVYNNFFQ